MDPSLPDTTTLRIIDANLNRAREALRVMEEYARFVLDDAALCARFKETRHALAAAIPQELGQVLAACREIESDVGRDLRTEREYQRTDAAHVALTAGKRLSEALRSIEEYAKTIDGDLAACVEQVRYRGYELERRLALHVRAVERFGDVRLYVLITESLCAGDWRTTAKAALGGGAQCLQLREKNLSDAELLSRAKKLAELCHRKGALFIVNDRPDVATLAGADGVHLGKDDLSVAEARRIIGPDGIVGVSTHTIDQFAAAVATAPDYVAIGPMFQSETKPQGHIAGVGTLAEARKLTSLPIVAIGGIDDSNVREVLSAADCCICACSAIIGRPDVEGATRRLRAIIDNSSTGNPGGSQGPGVGGQGPEPQSPIPDP